MLDYPFSSLGLIVQNRLRRFSTFPSDLEAFRPPMLLGGFSQRLFLATPSFASNSGSPALHDGPDTYFAPKWNPLKFFQPANGLPLDVDRIRRPSLP